MLFLRSTSLRALALMSPWVWTSTRAFAPHRLLGSSRSLLVPTSTTLLFSEKNNNSAAPRHDVGSSAQMELSPEEQAKMEAYGLHQQSAPKLDWATDVRTLVQYNHGFAVLSTFSKSDPDYPGGSVVGFAPDEQGRPIFIFSGMSTHTQDILANPHCSLTVAAKDFKSAADGRVNLMGRAELIRDSAEKEAAKAVYLKKHPGAFWVNFGDFNWFRMTVDKVRFVGGFARAGSVTHAEYTAAQPDAIAEFGPLIAQHMNEDHMPATIAMVHSAVPGMEPDPSNPITEAIITSVDSLGMYIKVTREKPVKYLPQQFKLRLPFPRPAVDRKDVKTLIVELTQAAATAKAE
jgi:putative heme iron utilization protein